MAIFRIGWASGLFFILYLPIALLMINSFNSSRYGFSWQGFSWKWYQKLWENDALLQATLNSLTIASLSASLATLIGLLTAILLYRYRFWGERGVTGTLFILLVTPDIVMAISFLAIFMLLEIELGFWSLLIAHTTFSLPFVAVTLYARLQGFDPALIEAARDLGAAETTILGRIILPLLLPALASGWLLAFTLSMDDVIVSSFVTGPGYEILPLKVYSMVKVGVSPEVNAISTLLLLASVILVIVAQLLLRLYRRA